MFVPKGKLRASAARVRSAVSGGNSLHRTILVVCMTILAVSAATATAKSLLTGKDIKDGSLTARDIKKGSISLNRLSGGVQKQIKKGLVSPSPSIGGQTAPGNQGENGSAGATGAAGAKGDKGDTGEQGPQGPRGDGQMNVDAAGNGFTPSNPSVKFGSDGVDFGPYTNNGAGDQTSGGTLKYTNIPAGTTLADIAQLNYTASYHHDGANDNGDAPYLRVFIDNNGDGFDGSADDHDIIFSPSTQPGVGCAFHPGSTQCNSSDRTIHYDVTQGTVRYDDDAGNAADQTWDEVVNAHKDDKVFGVFVSLGNSLPGTQSGVLSSLAFEFAGQAPTEAVFGN